MAEKLESEKVEVIEPLWQRASNHQTIYANNSKVIATTYDIQLLLAQMIGVDGKPVSQEVATIFMAPGQAKAMALLLLAVVSGYERDQNITFPLPEHMSKLAPLASEVEKIVKK